MGPARLHPPSLLRRRARSPTSRRSSTRKKPDPKRIAKIKAEADAEPTKGASPTALAQFYYDRGNARSALGRNREALADGEKALDVGKGAIEFRQVTRIRQFIGIQHNALGDPKKAVQIFQTSVREGNQPGQRGSLINAQRSIATAMVLMGDIGQAEAYIRRNASLVQDARGSPHPNWRNAYTIYGRSWEADADEGRALIFEARGQFKQAEAAYQRGEAFRRASVADLGKYEYPVPRQQVLNASTGRASHWRFSPGTSWHCWRSACFQARSPQATNRIRRPSVSR